MAHSKRILDKYLSQNVSKETQGLFAEWLAAPVDEELKDQILQDHWEREYYLSPEDIEKSYKAVRNRIEGPRQTKSVKSVRSLWIGVASAAAVAVFVALFAFLPARVEPLEVIEGRFVEMTECYVGNGEKQMITLSDSTSVILNSGSLLIYPKEFQGSRREEIGRASCRERV